MGGLLLCYHSSLLFAATIADTINAYLYTLKQLRCDMQRSGLVGGQRIRYPPPPPPPIMNPNQTNPFCAFVYVRVCMCMCAYVRSTVEENRRVARARLRCQGQKLEHVLVPGTKKAHDRFPAEWRVFVSLFFLPPSPPLGATPTSSCSRLLCCYYYCYTAGCHGPQCASAWQPRPSLSYAGYLHHVHVHEACLTVGDVGC